MSIPTTLLQYLLNSLRSDLEDHGSELPRAVIQEAVAALAAQARSEEQPTIEDRLAALSTWVKTIQDDYPGDLVKRLQGLEARPEEQPSKDHLTALEERMKGLEVQLRTKACTDDLPVALRDRLRTVEEKMRSLDDQVQNHATRLGELIEDRRKFQEAE